MQSLWAKHHVHNGSTINNGLAFLAGNATPHANHDVRIIPLQLLPAPQLGKNFFLGFVSYGAGIDQDHIGFIFPLSQLQAMRSRQNVRHLCRIVLVHLTTMRLYIQLAFHKLLPCCRRP